MYVLHVIIILFTSKFLLKPVDEFFFFLLAFRFTFRSLVSLCSFQIFYFTNNNVGGDVRRTTQWMCVKESKIILEQNIFLIIKFLEQNIFLIICNMGFLCSRTHSNNYAVQCRSTAVEKCNKKHTKVVYN